MNLFEQIAKRLPLISSKWFAAAISHLSCSEQFNRYLCKREVTLLNQIDEVRRILVLSDVNIGDAVNIQSCIEVLRYYFPDSEIDYAYNFTADPIINKNPSISNTFPIFHGSIIPSKVDCNLVQELFRKRSYDFVMNFCSFLSSKHFGNAGCPVLSPVRLVAEIIKAKSRGDGRTNLGYHITKYINHLSFELPESIRPRKERYSYSGSKIYISGDVTAVRDRYLRSLGVSSNDLILYFNPDTSNSYTFMNQTLQLNLLRKLLSYDSFDYILLGSGITFKGIERTLLDRIPRALRKKLVVLTKTLPINIYASLLDICDVFITGDTGPMHIAAARKVCVDKDSPFRNRTAIVSIFGATDPEIYGYDSFRDKYLGANQNAPSKVFEASPTCKNITCSIQRVTNRCSRGKCFDGLKIDEIVEYIIGYLSSQKSRSFL